MAIPWMGGDGAVRGTSFSSGGPVGWPTVLSLKVSDGRSKKQLLSASTPEPGRPMTSDVYTKGLATGKVARIPFMEWPMTRLVSFRATLLSAALAFTSAGALAAEATPRQDFLAAHIDTSVDPGVDFFQYANGAWLKAHPIPASEAAWGIGNEVDDELYARLRGISESAAKQQAAPGSDQQKIGDFWATAMDVAKADRLGLQPLHAELARIDAIASPTGVLDAVFASKPIGVGALFRIAI